MSSSDKRSLLRESTANRKRGLCKLAAAFILFWIAVAIPASAQSYPERPIRFVVPFVPGGAADTLARLLGQKIGQSFGQQVVIDNRGGGSGTVGTEMVARAAPNGYTILLGNMANLAIAPGLYDRLPYDPVRDFAPISLVAASPNVLVVHPSLPPRTFKEFVAYAKTRPTQLNYASSSLAVLLTGELLKATTGIEMQHVSYKGTGQAVVDVISGQVQSMFTSMSTGMPHIKAGKLRPLAVTSAQRWRVVPDVPTVAESGYPGFEATVWYGVLAPAGTPKPIVQRLHEETGNAMALPDFRERLQVLGIDMLGSTPEAFGAYIRTEIAKWSKVIKKTGVKPD